jgi:hypothetical protein
MAGMAKRFDFQSLGQRLAGLVTEIPERPNHYAITVTNLDFIAFARGDNVIYSSQFLPNHRANASAFDLT